jgi:protein-tyrosine phosphatase
LFFDKQAILEPYWIVEASYMIDRLDIEGLRPLFLSAHPFEAMAEEAKKDELEARVHLFIEELKTLEVAAVTVLLPSVELTSTDRGFDLISRYRDAGLSVIHFPLENFSIPDAISSFDALVKEIIEALRQKPLLIHCLAGCGRTALVAAGVLICRGSSAPDAIEGVCKVRTGTDFTVKQILFLKEYRRLVVRAKN